MSDSRKTVVYLLGAGATQGSVASVGSTQGILMDHLRLPLAESIRDLMEGRRKKYSALREIVNALIDDEADVEHMITFLDESPSALHRQFADELRLAFAKVLQKRLEDLNGALEGAQFSLYSSLLDMYLVDGFPEVLRGILSINYDEYVEAATEQIHGHPVDYGVSVGNVDRSKASVLLLKLHGSFKWRDTWPIEAQGRRSTNPLWIPPGIQKAKSRYPFGVLWGLARELLDCHVLRIIGCRLSGNDWDLLSLLFGAKYAHTNREYPYVIEVIDSPAHAFQLQDQYPYLDIRSVYEIEEYKIGTHFVADLCGGPPRRFEHLSEEGEKYARTRSYDGYNWFRLWLKQMARGIATDLSITSTHTQSRQFDRFLGEN